jgi:hypothetical protein
MCSRGLTLKPLEVLSSSSGPLALAWRISILKPWRLVLGAAVACAACCAAPIISGAAALGLGASGLFAGAMGALGAYTGSWLPVTAGALGLATVVGLVVGGRRRSAERGRGRCSCSAGSKAASCDESGRCAWPDRTIRS